ncbi:MAG: VIT and VWA domain-containing protein [Acidobacteriota bacterium]
MHRKVYLFFICLTVACLGAYISIANIEENNGLGFTSSASTKVTQGSLHAVSAEGNTIGDCPLKHTEVKAEINGFLSRVFVTQEFENPFKDKIEAIYTFPLPQNAAIDEMTMHIGERIIRGQIKRREEARKIYEAARNAGQVASLLDQERPNIFTQSVANIMPGEKINITISYVETLKYEAGSYEFVFPMVVGPRYIPGTPTGKQGGGFAPDTDRVPDASRITPPVAAPNTRAGHDISIEVKLDAGVPIDNIKSTLHDVDIDKRDAHTASITLRSKNEIPNKDFILKYDVAGRKIEDALMTHRGAQGGFFTFIMQPPERVTAEDVTPKEIVFVLDTSGSMMGYPIEKAKECMKLALDNLYPQDTFNLITFAGDTHILFNAPVPATRQNLARAQAFLQSRSGSGGTEMMKAIRAALDPSDKQDHIRIVCFMTDGYVGNDMEIISEVQKHPNARVFSFGIGSSVNRFLLDKMAEHGRGEVEYVTLQDEGSAAAKRLHERMHSPLLTDISIDWNGLAVADVYPKRIPDLFSAKPVVVTGRYTTSGKGVIYLKGKMAGRDVVKEIAVELPGEEPSRDVLAKLWARTRIEDLMSQDYAGAQNGSMNAELRETVTQVGLEYRLMTQFTSFVAVEEKIITEGGVPRTVQVPVEMPEGVSHKGIFGEDKEERSPSLNGQAAVGKMSARSYGIGGGGGGGVGRASAPTVSSPLPTAEPAKEKDDATKIKTPAGSKLHPSVAAIIDRLKKRLPASAEETKFVKAGKAELRVHLANLSKGTLAQLRQLGFEMLTQVNGSNVITGRLSIEKLDALAKLNTVIYIAPLNSN